MDRRDQQAIETLFRNLADVEDRSPPRDAEAERFIRSAVASQPAAPYYMAQTIVVQQQALEAAQERINELERSGTGGGLFGGVFGGGARPQRPAMNDPRAANAGGPWNNQQRGGGGFLAGAAQTAMGVAGGVILGNLIGGALFGGSSDAHAAEADSQPEPEPMDGGGDFDMGGDF